MLDIAAALGTAAAFFVGILAHEVTTARLADRMGDKVPRMRRRLSLSIKDHLDPLGTVILPAIFTVAALFGALLTLGIIPFGYGKRHDLNPSALRKPRRDIVIIALSGPAVTLALALAAGRAASAGGCSGVTTALFYAAFTLTAMTLVELIPMPGRDGGRVLTRFLKPNGAMKMVDLEHYDAAFVIGFLVVLAPIGRRMMEALLGLILGDSVCLG